MTMIRIYLARWHLARAIAHAASATNVMRELGVLQGTVVVDIWPERVQLTD